MIRFLFDCTDKTLANCKGFAVLWHIARVLEDDRLDSILLPIPPVPFEQSHSFPWNWTCTGWRNCCQCFAPTQENQPFMLKVTWESRHNLPELPYEEKKVSDLESLNFWITFRYQWKTSDPSSIRRNNQCMVTEYKAPLSNTAFKARSKF